MRVGILETGVPPGDLPARFGRYDAMSARLLGPGFATRSYRVSEGELPSDPAECDAYVVTGSSAGVYDPLPWIAPLKDFLRAARGRAKLVGLCFGHQVMAEAFGGRAEKSGKGRARDLHRYEVVACPTWMDGADAFSIPAAHGDQVTVLPPASTVVARSDFTPIAALSWDDGSAISFQGHPEFAPDFARALVERERGRVPDEVLDGAIATLDGPDDRERVAGWIRAFLTAPPPT